MPAPPYSSGNTMPTQPSSAICFQSGREKPVGVVRVAELAHARDGRVFAHPVGGGLREQFLIFGEDELHRVL